MNYQYNNHPPDESIKYAGEWAENPNNDEILMYKELITEKPIPKMIGKTHPPSWKLNNKSKFYVFNMENGRVWGKNGAVISQSNKLLYDVSFEYTSNSPEDHSIYKKEKLPVHSLINQRLAVVTNSVSGNYYHWMIETLPRIYLLQLSGLQIDKYIFSNLPTNTFHEETLKILNLSNEDLLICSEDFHIMAKELIIPSPLFFPSKWACNFLKESFIKNQLSDNHNKKKRIYVRREHTRRIINEEKIIEILDYFGFQSVQLELLSVDEQVKLFKSAEIIVSPHGAGLTNLVFCDSSTKVIEIFPSSYVQSYYYYISAFNNLDYYYIVGKKVKNSSLDSTWAGVDDIYIHPQKLFSMLKKIIPTHKKYYK